MLHHMADNAAKNLPQAEMAASCPKENTGQTPVKQNHTKKQTAHRDLLRTRGAARAPSKGATASTCQEELHSQKTDLTLELPTHGRCYFFNLLGRRFRVFKMLAWLCPVALDPGFFLAFRLRW